MFLTSWRIARVGGIEIRIDPSWAFIALLIGWNFLVRFDFLYEGLNWFELLALAVGAALVFFGSVLVHELAHALTFVRRGVQVDSITLFLFGGATRVRGVAERPDDEIAGTAVGPLASLGVAVVLGGIALGFGDPGDNPVTGALGYLAWLNLFLAVFNLLPGLPLDGGRLLRGIVWKATGDIERATRTAAAGGRIVGFSIIGLGILLLFAGGLLGALWLGAIGWFLAQAAQAEYEQFRLRRMLDGVPARDVMARDLVTIPAALTVEQAIDDYFLRYDHAAYPVRDGGAEGLVTLRRVRRVPTEERALTRIGDLAIPAQELDSVAPDAPMSAVIECLEDEEVNRVVVRDHEGHIVGLVTPTDVARWARRRYAFEDR